MKLLYSILAAGVAFSATAATSQTVAQLPFAKPERTLKANYRLSTQSTPMKAAPVLREAAAPPASILGESFVELYNYQTDPLNAGVAVLPGQEEGSLILSGFAEGLDVNATYDAATGKITVPTGVVIGTSETYGDITLYALDLAAGAYRPGTNLTGTWDGEKFVFDYSIYGLVSFEENGQVNTGGLIVAMNPTLVPSNASWKFTFGGENYQVPLLAEKTTANTVKLTGFSSLLYGWRYPLTFTVNETAATATVGYGTPIDRVQTSATTWREYFTGGLNVIGMADDLTMNVTVSEKTSLFQSDNMIYAFNNNGSIQGYTFEGVSINIDFNVYTGEVSGGGDNDTETPEINGVNYLLDREAKTAQVTGCIETLTTLNIPSTIETASGTYTVTSVVANAFKGNTKVTTLYFPATITKVETDAFRNMSNLRTLYVEDLTAYCGVDFANGNAVPMYNVFPTNTSKWGKVYFNGVEAGTEIVIPEGVEFLGRAFYGYKPLTAVTLPESLVTIGSQAFANCLNLKEAVIPANVESVGSVFFGCKAIEKITIAGTKLKAIGDSFCYNCGKLAEINIPEGIEKIGASAFSSCWALTELVLPSTLKELGNQAFAGCSGVTKIECLAVEPPTAANYAFDTIKTDIPVYVPEGSIEAYQAADKWADFTNYLPLVSTGIGNVVEAVAAPAEYYNLQGARIAVPQAGTVVIRRQGNKTEKVIF